MKQIKELFDPSKDIYRAIEKVITYGAAAEDRLQTEIGEYIVTENIDSDFEKLIGKMQAAMDMGGQNEIGVWVSGFYGSGKSSFTKYLGLALDDQVQVDGQPFIKHLQDRMLKAQTKAQLGALAKQFPAAVVMLDLASEMLAGATMAEVSTVLFYKVLQWAGYANNLKVAAFERRLQKDGRHEEFKQLIFDQLDMPWNEVQNDPLVVDSVIPEVAHKMYPKQFKTPTSFNTEPSDIVQFENQRVEEMLEIVHDRSGKDYVIFVVDEVGQYVGSRDNLILNLDGLAKNLKAAGNGRAWIIGTAQQTLTEDDPRAALNSDKLYKLKDRFPIQIDLESSDIREICHRRLLGKSSSGEAVLGKLFDEHGQKLRTNTKLQDAKFYDSEFDKTAFVELYPFLPAHFDILLHLLGALAKSTGGIGLRSAIKVIQDILIEGPEEQTPVADNQIGWLATSVTLYDALEKDIRRAFPSIYKAAEKAISVRFPDSPLHQDVAKTVAVLQILSNMPVTSQNVAALMHPSVDANGRFADVQKAIEDLISDPIVPFGEKDGNLCFFSEKLNEIERERAEIPLRTIETRRIQNEALKTLFSPLPSTRLDGSLNVTSGLRVRVGGHLSNLAGDRETIQTIVEFVDPTDYDTVRAKLIDESREKASQNSVYLVGRSSQEIDEKVAEIYRCREVVTRYRSDPDQEIKEYCNGQQDRATRLEGELEVLLRRSLMAGSFVFRADPTAVDSIGENLGDACRKHLAGVAAKIFDRYSEAPHRAETSLAEQFLRVGNLKAITSKIDPLGLVQVSGGAPKIDVDHKALVSIRDYIDRNGSVDGKRLISYFGDAPFGWSQDTLRYLIAAMLCGGEIKLKVSGNVVTVNGQQAIEALRTNNSFKKVGLSLRDGRPSIELLSKAAERLTELLGDQVLPLEDEISKAVTKKFPSYQSRYSPLAGQLDRLGLPGAERIRSLTEEIDNLLLTDASDAPQQLGSEESTIYEGLTWACEVAKALEQGLEEVVEGLQTHILAIQALPDSGVPGELKSVLSEEIETVLERMRQDDFRKHSADLNSSLTEFQSRTRDAAIQLGESQKLSIAEAQSDLANLADWSELTQEEKSDCLAQVEALSIDATDDLAGLKKRLSQDFVIGSKVSELKKSIEQRGAARRLERLEQEKEKAKQAGKTTLKRTVNVPAKVTEAGQLDGLISQLNTLREELSVYSDIEVTIRFEE